MARYFDLSFSFIGPNDLVEASAGIELVESIMSKSRLQCRKTSDSESHASQDRGAKS